MSTSNNDSNADSNDPPTPSGQSPLPSFEPGGFNIGDFRLPQAYAEHAGGAKLITTIPVRRPSKQSWFRTHHDEEYRFSTPLIELKDQQDETYLVVRSLWPELISEPTFVPKLLTPTLTRQNVLLLWPMRLPGPDGKLDPWSQSAFEAARIARDRWVRLCSNRSLGAYETMVAPDPQQAPIWPKLTLNEILKIAFKGRIIETLDHPVIRNLRGEA